MRNIFVLALLVLISACSSTPKDSYPYGMNEKEWNELSIKDKAKIRRDFYFYEKGNVNFVDPQMEVEGKKELPSVYEMKKNQTPAPKHTMRNAE